MQNNASTPKSPEEQRSRLVFDLLAPHYNEVFADIRENVSICELVSQSLPHRARVLDVGCGTGIPIARQLCEHGFDVVGIDISPKMIEVAKAGVPKATFVEMNACNIRFAESSFDAVFAFCSLLLQSRADMNRSYREVSRVLKPGGVFVLTLIKGVSEQIEAPVIFSADHTGVAFRIPEVSLLVSKYPREEALAELANAGFNCVGEASFHHRSATNTVEEHLCLRCLKD